MTLLKYFSYLKLMVFIMAFVFTSCSHYYYTPSAHNVPLFHKKNECQAAIILGGNDVVETSNVQAAYAITNNIAVIVNTMFAKGGEKTSADWGRGNCIDGALGFYTPIKKHGVFEIFAGYGESKQHHQYSGGTADLHFTKFFLQPSIGLSYKRFDIALTAGISNINFYKINKTLDRNHEETYTLNTISQNHNSYLFEPSITLRGGLKYVKAQLQISLSKNLSHSNLPFLNNNISFGLNFSLSDDLYKKLFKRGVK